MATTPRFLHLGVNDSLRSAEREEIELVLDRAKDWLRYAGNCWLIYTSKEPKDWYERLKGTSALGDAQFFIFEANVDERAGWLPKSTWAWLKRR